MGNTLWVFGDSFTYGHGLNFSRERTASRNVWDHRNPTRLFETLTTAEQDSFMLDLHPVLRSFKSLGFNNEDKTWSSLLANKLGLKLENRGQPGMANIEVIERLIADSSRIQRGDVVIVGTTLGTRLMVPAPGFVPGGVNTLPSCAIDVAYAYKDEFKKKKSYDYRYFDDTKYKALVDYKFHVLYGSEQYLEEMYSGIIGTFCYNVLRPRGVKYLTWKSEKWHDYEVFRNAKGDQYADDGHWSIKGNNDFFEDLYKEYYQKYLNFI